MSIQATQAYNYVNTVSGTAAAKATGTYSSGGTAATASRPAEQNDRSVALSEQGKEMSQSDQVYKMDTGAGEKYLDLGSFFASPGRQVDSLSLDGLLLPTENNVRALQEHISSVFPGFLAENGIPEAPDKITYDSSGNMVLPADYPYADKLKAALENDPALARELSTANALASHLAGIKATEPFQQEYAQAKSQAEIDAIIDKYSYLFGENRRYPDMALLFTNDGQLTITADDKALV
ncbi:hypothetical protein [Marinobacterium arenosum]|uniref:hypothetical protein n=1 Tax=Marinobacterium arenosum TaxID=2862496 RepID=UPI001C969CBB|nr:hypothetical protein [Marinobacterium arenosum]MBY4679025.1 hypothetical protein [Marinobacterium arenosum]